MNKRKSAAPVSSKRRRFAVVVESHMPDYQLRLVQRHEFFADYDLPIFSKTTIHSIYSRVFRTQKETDGRRRERLQEPKSISDCRIEASEAKRTLLRRRIYTNNITYASDREYLSI